MINREKALAILNKIKGYCTDSDGWKESKKTRDVTVWWKPSPDWNGILYKSEGMINASPETVFAYIEPNPTGPRCKWDNAVKNMEIVEEVDSEVLVLRTVTHSAVGGLVSSRDFIDLVINENNGDFLATCAQATEHAKFPAAADIVRGNNYPCAIICHRVPSEPNQCRMTSYVQSDLGGMLPKSLVENVMPSNQVNFFTALKKYLKADGKLGD